MSFLAALYAALMLILNPAALHHPHSRPHVRLVLPDVPTHNFSASPELKPPAPRSFNSGAPQQPETNRGNNYTASEHQLGTEALPLVVKIGGTVKNEATTGQNKTKTDEKPSTDWVAVFTAGLIIVGFLQLIVFGLQAYFLNRTIRKMDQIATSQRAETAALLVAAQDNATATAEHARHMEQMVDVTKSIQRAYIAVDGLGIEDLHLRPIAQISISNAGNLRAQGIRWVIDAAIDPDDEREIFDINETTMLPSNNILTPRAEMRRFYDPKFTRQEVYNFETGNAVLYVWGIVYYIDGFQTWRWLRADPESS